LTRHTITWQSIDRGISSTVLAALMGHESSTITERRYIHLFDRLRTDDAVRRAMGFSHWLTQSGGIANV
jgi:integrase